MPVYQFEALRSKEKKHQVPGVQCDSARVAGRVEAGKVAGAVAIVRASLWVAGVWRVTLWKGKRQLPVRIVDNRPE